eukprot:COSAG05_NODE_1101_length_5877_cov_9.449983_6_plen_682_part_01
MLLANSAVQLLASYTSMLCWTAAAFAATSVGLPLAVALPADGAAGAVRLQRQGDTWWFLRRAAAAGSSSSSSSSSSFVSAGVDHVMFSGDDFGAPAGAEYERAVQQKYAGNRTAWAEASVGRISGAGFNTLGSWSSATCPDCWQTDCAAQEAGRRRAMFYTPIVDFVVLHNRRFNSSGFPDVFHPQFNLSARDTARRACASRANDSLVLGYFLDNELSCPPYPEAALSAFLRMPPTAPGFAQAMRFQAALSDNDQETNRKLHASFAALVARQYFRVTTSAIRAFDPNHLILGCKFTNGDGLGPLIAEAAPFVDAHAVDSYAFTPGVHYMRHLYQQGGKLPFVIAEFGFQSYQSFINSSIHMGGAGPLLPTQAVRGSAWSDFVRKAVSLEFVVGYHHFQYMDQPADPHKLRNTNYGMVSVHDEAYTELLAAMTRTNAEAHEVHSLGAAGQQCKLDQQQVPDGNALLGRPFRILHNTSGLCVVASATAATAAPAIPLVLVACDDADANSSEQTWKELANGRLRHIASARCLDLDRSVSQSSKVGLTLNCSTDIEVEVPAAWEHGVDCLVMNFCRWEGHPVCGYEQTCLATVGDEQEGEVARNVGVALCQVGAASQVWKFQYTGTHTRLAQQRQQQHGDLSAEVSAVGRATTTPKPLFSFRCRATPTGKQEGRLVPVSAPASASG